ncbi:MAG: hypothetical protein JWR49_3827, partial [Tardiphaga sp.]|nr:hypothetical protein [Tardiphaga sp.]
GCPQTYSPSRHLDAPIKFRDRRLNLLRLGESRKPLRHRPPQPNQRGQDAVNKYLTISQSEVIFMIFEAS